MFQMIVAWKYSEYLKRRGGDGPAATTTSAELKERSIRSGEGKPGRNDSRQPGGNEGPSLHGSSEPRQSAKR